MSFLTITILWFATVSGFALFIGTIWFLGKALERSSLWFTLGGAATFSTLIVLIIAGLTSL